MKSNFLRLSYFAIAAAGMLTACNQENVSSDMANSGNVLSISVSQNDFSPVDAESRAVTDMTNRTTTFENGDKLGLYVVSNADGSYHYENVPFTYNEGAWTSASTIYYYKNSDYIVYYPYDENLQFTVGETGVSGAIKTVFERKADFYTQNTADAYEAVDLMMAEVEDPSAANVDFNLAHKFSMIEISVPVRKYITKKEYEGNKFEYTAPVKLGWYENLQYDNNEVSPYNVGKGIYRFIVKPGTNVAINIDGYVQYEENGAPYNFSNENASSLTLSEGSFKHYKVTVANISDEATERNLEVGDYYYSDGSIYPGEENNPIIEGCIGVVYDVENANDTDGKNTWNHGFVLALSDVEGESTWGNATLESNILPWNSNFTNENPDGDTQTLVNEVLSRYDGYKACVDLMSLSMTEGKSIPAIEQAVNFKQYMAPKVLSSGWYLPSVGQLYSMMDNLGQLGFDGNYKSLSHLFFGGTRSQASKVSAKTKIKEYINKINPNYSISGIWKLATETSETESWVIEWADNNIKIFSRAKTNSEKVHPVLSF